MARRALTAVLLLALAPASAAARPGGLRAFPSCAALLDYARANAARAVATGWTPRAPAVTGLPVTSVPSGPAAPSAGAEGAPAASPDFSSTNVQEPGVEEPDVVKTDGRTVFAIANGTLYAVDARAERPRLVGRLALDAGYGQELLAQGDRLLVLQSATAIDARGGARAVTRLTYVDVSDPAAMRVLSTQRADGEYVTARQIGATARIAIVSRAAVVEALGAVSAPGRRALVARRERLVRRAQLAAWRPGSYLRDRRAGRPRSRFGPLVACDDVRRPQRFSGLDTVTILTVDLTAGLPAVDADAILADAQVVYGSRRRLYVATQRWLAPRVQARDVPPPLTTEIHSFEALGPRETRYAASGSVEGFVLSQFALSEHDGVLRVASTAEPAWWAGGAGAGSDSAVSTLDAATLAPLGRVGGLGRGERIQAVRFIGARGYVVTFRRVDPLYVLDLSEPTRPAVTGELKIAGYSAYLHPLGGDLLLGVGQDAGPDGVARGAQLSLFDVADPARPRRLAAIALGEGSSSAVEFDHRAFLYWAPTGLAVVPVGVYSSSGPWFGALGVRVQAGELSEVGRVEHPGAAGTPPAVLRALVVGDRLLTLSDAGLLASGLSDLAPAAFVAWPDAPPGGEPCPPDGFGRPCVSAR